MTKTDDVLLELNRAFAECIASVIPFQWRNKTYRLINCYIASPWTRCDDCGNYPISDVFVIESSDGKSLRVGSKCIDHLTNRKVSECFETFMTRRKNIINNRQYIDGFVSMLTECKHRDFPFQMSEDEVRLMQNAVEHMCSGFNLDREQEQVAQRYINKDLFSRRY